jgi:hypothetical protein
MKRLALTLAAISVAATPAVAASPASHLSLTRAATPATKQAHLAGEWHGFPVWSLAVGAILLTAGIIITFTNSDGIDDQPDSN